MSDLDSYWAHADYSLYIYREKTLIRENPVNHLAAFRTCLLSTYLAPAGYLWYSIFLLFCHFGNYCYCNKPIDALVSRIYFTTIELLGGTYCLPCYPLFLFPL